MAIGISVADDQLTPFGQGGNHTTTESSGQWVPLALDLLAQLNWVHGPIQQLPDSLLQEGLDLFHGVQISALCIIWTLLQRKWALERSEKLLKWHVQPQTWQWPSPFPAFLDTAFWAVSCQVTALVQV